jgi:hypothetical protein
MTMLATLQGDLKRYGRCGYGVPEDEEEDMPEEKMDPETARLLKEYLLAAKEEERAKKIDKILEILEKHTNWQTSHDVEDKKNFTDVKGDIRGLSLRIGQVEDKMDRLEDEIEHQKEDTLSGLKVELEKEKQKREKRKELNEARRYNAAEWLKQNWVPILISVVSAAVAAYATFKK